MKVKINELSQESLDRAEQINLQKLTDEIIKGVSKENLKFPKSFIDRHYDRIKEFENNVSLLYDKMYQKYYNGNNKILHTWSYIYLSSLRIDGKNAKGVIRHLLKEGKKVKTGYFCTKIKGYHDYIILYK